MKKHDYKELSKTKCIDCGKPLKLNLVMNNIHANRCFCCHNLSKGKKTSIRNRYHLGTLVNTKTIDYLKIQKQNRRIWK